jgi:hypothetical protein
VGESVYVYGVVAAGDAGAVQVSGVDGFPVRTVAGDRLGALVSDLDAETLTAARAVRAHWGVLDAAAEHATVVPVRFGTVLAGDDAVRDELLTPNADRLERLLAALAGRVQLKVEGRYDEQRLLAGIVAGSPSIARLQRRVQSRSAAAGYYDRINLGQAIAGEVDRRRARDAEHARAVLEPLAEACRVEDARTPDTAFNLSFLVAREGVDDFGAGVAALREAAGDGIAIRFVGPLPPYSFADAELTPAGAA